MIISSGSGKLATSGITSTELNYLDNATSNIQTQINTNNTNITALATALLDIYTKTQVDTLISTAGSTRIIESSLLTKVQGGTGGVQLLSSDNSLLLEASTAAVSSLKRG